MKKAKTKITLMNTNRGFSTHRISIPASVVKDSTYPFKAGEEVEVEIVGKTIVIRKPAYEVEQTV